MSKITIVEGNSNDKDNVRVIMVKGEKGETGDPTKLSQLENDENFISRGEVYTKEEIDTTVETLNETIDEKADQTNIQNQIDTINSTKVNKSYVDINFATKTELDTDINNVSSQLSSLASGSPLVASSVSGMTNTSKIYVNTTDGNWYYYNGSNWVVGGVYQSVSESEKVNFLTDYEKYNYTNITDLDETIGYNLTAGKLYKFVLKNGAITYSSGSTSLCLQYYDTPSNSYKDIIRLRGNIDTQEQILYLSPTSDVTNLRLVAHSTASTYVSLEVYSLENCIFATKYYAGSKNTWINYSLEADKEYLFAVRLGNINQAGVQAYMNQSIIGIKGTNTYGDDNGEIFKRIISKSLETDMPTFQYFTFKPSQDYVYLNIYGRPDLLGHDGFEIYDLTDSDLGEIYKKEKEKENEKLKSDYKIFSENSNYEKMLVKLNETNWLGVNTAIDYIPGPYSYDSDRVYDIYNEVYFTFNYSKILLDFDASLYKVKLYTYDENLSQIATDKPEEPFIFNPNSNYFYRVVIGNKDGTTLNNFEKPTGVNFYYLKYKGNNKSNRLFNTINSLKTPHLYGHRGYQAEAPENSIPAFRLAGEYGFWGIETDLYATSDGVIVCMHDTTIDRMTDGTGTIANMTYQELSQYHIDSGTNVEQYTQDELKIPTIDDYLSICRYYGLVPFIELKTDIVEAVVQKLKDYGLENNAIMSSFDWNLIVKTRQISSMYVHWIKSDTSDTHIDDLEAMGNAGRSFNYQDLTTVPSTLNATMNNKGLGYCFRAADTVANVKKQIELGVTYIPTNIVKPSELL